MLTCTNNFISDSDVFFTVHTHTTLIHQSCNTAECYTTTSTQNKTKQQQHKVWYKIQEQSKSLRSQTTACTDNEHIVILHHWQQHSVTAACEQIHYFNHLYCSVCAEW